MFPDLSKLLNYSRSNILVVFLFVSSIPGWGQDRIIDKNDTIDSPIETIVEGKLTINQSIRLVVNSTLVVKGDFWMENFAEFKMGPEAIVLVTGNFHGSNKVDIDIASYFIVQGNFTGQNQNGTLDATNGNIYIFGDVEDKNWPNFQSCDNYEGNSNDVGNTENCDYGTETAFENNLEDILDDIPVEIIEELDCFGLLTWTGQINSNWFTPENWSCNQVPTINHNVLIPSGLTNYPQIISLKATAKDLTIENNASLEVTGTLEIAGAISNTGILDVTAGNLSFAGSDLQTLPMGSILNDSVFNLYLNNPDTLFLDGPTFVTNILRTSTGTLVTNNNLTLVSTADKTALISGAGNGKMIGNVTIQRFIDPAFGYKYFSSPVKDASVGDFAAYLPLTGPDNFPHFYRYNENRKDSLGRPATGWQSYTDIAKPLNVLEGYAANFGNKSSAVTISLTGEVNNGTYSRTLTNNAGTYTKGFNLVGNPYPSPVDWNSDGWTKTNVGDAIYFFTADASNPYVGTYTSYVPGVSSDGISSNIIPSMQGFFVHVTDGFSQGFLEVNNTARIEDFGQPFIKSKVSKEVQVLRLNAGFEGEILADPLTVYFGEPTSASFNSQKEALKLMNTNPKVPNLYGLTSEGKELSIDAISRNPSEDKIRIPLGLKLEESGTVIFRLGSLGEDFMEYHIYLIDLQKAVVTKVDLEDTYSVNMDKGTHNSRFVLVLSRTAVPDTEVLLERSFTAKATGTGIKILVSLKPGQEGDITVSNLSGQILKTIKVKDQKEVFIEGIKSSGIYIVSMRSGDILTTRKILINK